jgi:hypothetical protein
VSIEQYVNERAGRSGAGATVGKGTLEIETASGEQVSVPLPEDWSSAFDLHHAFPGRARGDQREFLLAATIQDAASASGVPEDKELRKGLAEQGVLPVPDDVQRNVLASVMREHYWVRPDASARASRPFAFPFHAAISANYKPPGRYKMYRSDILLFLCWDGQDFDHAPLEALCNLLSDSSGFTLLDEALKDAAVQSRGEEAITEISANALLASTQAVKVRDYLANGAFHQPALDRFRADLITALEMGLPRHDRVEAAILTLSLHLALYYYEVAYLLGAGLDSATHAAAGSGPPPLPPFAGLLRFRVGAAGDRPVRREDGCAAAWRQLDDRYLISLMPNLGAANLLHGVWRAARPAEAPPNADPRALAAALAQDSSLRSVVDVAAGALALVYADQDASASDSELGAIAASEQPGIYLLRSTIHDHLRGELHYRSRAVVNQLVKRTFGGSLIRRRGSVLFFELDEELLFLLVKFVLRRQGDVELPFQQFLAGLAQYGLAPQDRDEEDELAESLERLGMLHRYSDAGEAMYVRHLL